jgi:carboxyl-terminal processing protease
MNLHATASSDRTVSAGETFTLLMRQLPHVTQIGQATAGSISDILDKPLPGHFRITIPNEIDRTPDGTLFEARGIPPQQPLQLFDPASLDTLFTGHDAAITAILDRIGSGP